jgi:hypothetical protein
MYRFDPSAESRFLAVFLRTGSQHGAGLAFCRQAHHRVTRIKLWWIKGVVEAKP